MLHPANPVHPRSNGGAERLTGLSLGHVQLLPAGDEKLASGEQTSVRVSK